LRFDEILARADDETLSHLIGQAAMRLIMALDPGIATPSNLRDIVIQLHTREGLLLSRESRAPIIDLLPLQQAKFLASVLGIKSTSNVYDELKRVKISRNSERERALFDFFELIPPQNENVLAP